SDPRHGDLSRDTESSALQEDRVCAPHGVGDRGARQRLECFDFAQRVDGLSGRGDCVPTATCDIRFSLQNRYAEESFVTALESLGISNRAVTISGRATRSEQEITKAEFVGTSAEAIRTVLSEFLKKHFLPRAND